MIFLGLRKKLLSILRSPCFGKFPCKVRFFPPGFFSSFPAACRAVRPESWIESSKTTTPAPTMDLMRVYGSAWDLMEARSIEHLAEDSVKKNSLQLYKSIAVPSSATSSLVSAIVSSALRTSMVQAGLQA